MSHNCYTNNTGRTKKWLLLSNICSEESSKRRTKLRQGEQLLVDIRALKKEMDAAYLRFEYGEDDDSVEAAIYELESLKRRYHRLLKLAKQEGLESSDIAVCYKLE